MEQPRSPDQSYAGLSTIVQLCLCTVAISVGSSCWAQKMYRCGSTYSQTPCGAEAKEIEIKGAPAASSGVVSQKLPDNAPEELKTKSIELCKLAVLGQLKDPDSAKFQNISRSNSLERRLPILNGPLVKTSGFNGYVNAKNSYGGYTGNKLFFCSVDYETETRILDVTINR